VCPALSFQSYFLQFLVQNICLSDFKIYKPVKILLNEIPPQANSTQSPPLPSAPHSEECCQMVHFLTFNVNLGKFCNERCWYMLWTLCPFYCHLVYFLDICSILWSFWYIYFPVCCTKKYLATLIQKSPFTASVWR
jgi:hypothetical protein